jgi:CDP-diacylglycerol pyrophosphatase
LRRTSYPGITTPNNPFPSGARLFLPPRFRSPLRDTRISQSIENRNSKIKNTFHPTVFAAKETNHRKLNDNLGMTGDPATKVLQEFVDACLAE